MLARFIYTHSRYFWLIILSTLAVGLTSLNTISRQEDPTITNYVASITSFYPGATPDRVEALISKPLEDELREIPEVENVDSTSSSGVSSISVRLHDTLPADTLERTWSEVRDAMGDAALRFPAGAGEPSFDNDRMNAFTAIVAITGAPDLDVPLSLLYRVSQDLADRARNLSGTKLVEMFGEPREEIRVEIDEAALLARGLSLSAVTRALRAADVKIASGRASGGGSDLLIELEGDLDSTERIRQVIVNTSPRGSATRITDLGRVYRASSTPPPAMAIAQGRHGILLGVTMANGRQVDVWGASFRDLLDDFRQQAPAGVDLELSYDQSIYTETRLSQVSSNLAMGVTLVILVLLVTLGWRAAMVVAVILPLCGVISIAVLEFSGIALHQMSITGLIVALGLLVDSSIVMTDEIRKRLLQGHSPIESISGSVNRLRIPLIASALTTVLAFTPMAIVPGPAGDFLGSLAKAVIVMLLTSTVLALVVTPVLAAWLLPRLGPAGEKVRWYSGGADSGWLGKQLTRALDWSLRNPVGAICLSLILPVTGFIAFPTLTAQFFPGTDRDQLSIQVKLADGRSIYDTLALVEKIDNYLDDNPEIRRVDWTLGEDPPPFYYNLYRTREAIPSWATALVLTRDEQKTDALILRLQSAFDEEFPEARIIVRGIDQGPPVFAPLELKIFGPNQETLRELGEQFRRRLDAIPAITHSSATQVGGAPKLVYKLDEHKLRLAGLSLADAASALEQSLRGEIGGEILEGTERLPVKVRYAESDWGTAERIADIRIPLPPTAAAGSATMISGIPLNALGTVKVTPANSPIGRENGERLNLVQGYIRRGILPEEALKFLRADLEAKPIVLPPGYRMEFGGDADERQETIKKLMAPLGMIISALLATLVMTFNSWRLAAVALLVCVCSLGLSLLSLAIFRYPFGITAITGVIGSIGVSINAAIIIMTALQEHGGSAQGGVYAIRSVVMDSSRHIISTTITTFGGFLPLILEGGQFWSPFAMAIAGGVLLSTIVSFFLVPPMFLLVRQPLASRPLNRRIPGFSGPVRDQGDLQP